MGGGDPGEPRRFANGAVRAAPTRSAEADRGRRCGGDQEQKDEDDQSWTIHRVNFS
jgi:hypothetical protein